MYIFARESPTPGRGGTVERHITKESVCLSFVSWISETSTFGIVTKDTAKVDAAEYGIESLPR